MKKALALLAAFALALLLGLPWYIGKQTEQRYRELAQSGDAEGVRLARFDRGWFHSTAELELDPARSALGSILAGIGGDGGSARLVDRVAHGPLPLDAGSDWAPGLVAIESGLADGPVLARYRLGLDGGLSGEANIPSLEAPLAGQGNLSARGIAADYFAAGDLSRLELSLQLESFELERAAMRWRAETVALATTRHMNTTGLLLGEAEGSAASGSIEPAGGGDALAWRGLRFRTGSSDRDGRVRGRLDASLSRLEGPNHGYGPGKLVMAFRDVDAASLGRLQAAAARFSAQGLPPRSLAMAMVGALYAELPELLGHRPVLTLDELSLETPDGSVTAAGRLAVTTGDRKVLNNPYLLQRAFSGEFNLSVPVALGERLARFYLVHRPGTPPPDQAAAWLERQTSRGMLERTDTAYRLRVRYASGRMTVNGRPWPDRTETRSSP